MLSKKTISTSLFLLFLFFLTISNISAQILVTPRVSPHSTVKQSIGLAEIEIDYHRPAVNDREVWGKLVPYGMSQGVPFGSGNEFPWRAGANDNTVLTLSHDATVEGKKLKAGSYGLHMIPNENEWVIIFSSNTGSWGSFHYDKNEDVLRVKVKPTSAEFKESLEYGFDNLSLTSATAYLHWEKLRVPFKFEFDTHGITFASFENQLRNLAGFNWQGWNTAAFYCVQNNVNLEQGLAWIEKSISINENVNNRNLKGYVLMGLNRMDEALALFKDNIEQYPENWNVYDSYAEALGKAGDKSEAIDYYEEALEKSPQGQKQRIENAIKTLQGE